jgi:hypothetical protein
LIGLRRFFGISAYGRVRSIESDELNLLSGSDPDSVDHGGIRLFVLDLRNAFFDWFTISKHDRIMTFSGAFAELIGKAVKVLKLIEAHLLSCLTGLQCKLVELFHIFTTYEQNLYQSKDIACSLRKI